MLVVEIDLSVMVAFLEFLDRDLLSFVKVDRVCVPVILSRRLGPAILLFLISRRATQCHAVNVEDHIRVDYGKDGHQDQTHYDCDKPVVLLTRPRIEHHVEEAGEY